MLIEVKVKVAVNANDRLRKKTWTVVLNKEFFSEAEYAVTAMLTANTEVAEFSIVSLKQSTVTEVASQFEGASAFIATLKDIFTAEDGTEKPIKYKVLLWADDLQQAMTNIHVLASQGYNMSIEGVKEVDYIYMDEEDTNGDNRSDS